MRLSIFGSCISRDIFRELNLNSLVHEYRARSSIHSLVRTENADLSNVNLPKSNFQAKMVISDFNKDPLKIENSDFLILDLIDERFDIITNFNSVVTYSNELKDNNKNIQPNNFIERGTSVEYDMWRESIKKFKEIVDIPIILHKSRLSSQLNVEKSDIIINQRYISSMNERMKRYEKIIYEELDIFGTIDVGEEFLVSDVSHIWGYSPYHYVKDYYFQAMEKIFEITKTDRRFGLVNDNFKITVLQSTEMIKTEVEAKQGHFTYAYYIYENENIIHKEWYTENTSFNYASKNNVSKSISVTVFVCNMYNEKLMLDRVTV